MAPYPICCQEIIDIFLLFILATGKELTDAHISKLSKQIRSKQKLWDLACNHFNVPSSVVMDNMRKPPGDVRITAYHILADWWRSQPTLTEPYNNLCEALKKEDMGHLIKTTLQ